LIGFTTAYNPGNAKRTHNMRRAIQALNGKTIPPGGVFSLNRAVGLRTQQRGYRTAIIFEERKKTFGIGGGVSQVTGTLFNAALLAGLPIVQYHTHSRPVHYLPMGRDATVSWGHFDMQFKNNTPTPLKIVYRMKKRTITAVLIGRKTPGLRVNVSVHSRKVGPNHYLATLYRTMKRNGKVLARERIGTSDYNWKEANED
jgi:vancomycin resistance protein YoaR